MTKEQRNLLQGVKVGSVIDYINKRGFHEYGVVLAISFTEDNTNAYLLVRVGNSYQTDITDIYQVDHIVISSKVKKMFGVK